MADDAIIAFLPEDGSWCKQDLPHMTLAYVGPISERSDTDFNSVTKDAITAARVTGPFSLEVTGVEEWGTDERVDVLTLYPTPQLLVARKLVEHWDTGEFPEFKPHATIGPAGSAFSMKEPYTNAYEIVDKYESYSSRRDVLPDRLYFNRVCVTWGDKKLVFRTNSF